MHIPIKKIIFAALIVFLLKITVADPLLSRKNQNNNQTPEMSRRLPASEDTATE